MDYFLLLAGDIIEIMFLFVEKIHQIATNNNYSIKNVDISFDSKQIEMFNLFGFISVSMPKIYLPKVDINFERITINNM